MRLEWQDDRPLLILSEDRPRLEPEFLKAVGLSPREAEVLALVAEGRTNAEVARLLFASPRTIGKHLEHIYRKLGVENRSAAVLRVLALLSAWNRTSAQI